MIDKNNSLPQLPGGWAWTTFEGIAANEENSIVDGPFGSNLKVSDYIADENGVPVLTTRNLEVGYDKQYVRYISMEKFQELRRSEVKGGDILVAKIGSCGKSSIYPENGKSAMIPANLLKMTIHPELSKLYVYYFLSSLFFKMELEKITTATAQPAFNVTKFRKLPVPLPPLPEQHRIIAKIEELSTKLDAGLVALKKVKAQLKSYRQTVLKHAFEGKMTKEWQEAHKGEMEPASVLLERIKEERKKNAKGKYKELPSLDTSDLPQLPGGWVWARIGEIAEVVRGASPRPKGNPRYFGGSIPWIMISDISREKGKYISKTRDTVTNEGAEKSRYLAKGTLILSNSGTVCVPKILAVDGCIHDGFVAFTDLTEHTDLLYIYHYFNYVRPRIIQENWQGVTQVNLNTNIVRGISIPLPPLTEQHKIVEEIERHFSMADKIEEVMGQSLMRAGRLRQGILKRAFEGKLVPQDPNDEPAQKLLERIKAEKAKREVEKKATGRGRKRLNTIQGRLM